jgi:hypothetical protein
MRELFCCPQAFGGLAGLWELTPELIKLLQKPPRSCTLLATEEEPFQGRLAPIPSDLRLPAQGYGNRG